MIRILSLSMITTGAAAFGLVGYMQYDPLAFTSPTQIEPEATPARTVPESAPKPVTEPDPPATLEMPPVTITARASVKPRTAIEPVVAPCSPWRELGFTYVENGEASGTQRVRELCARDFEIR